jgi:chlorite dismutase/nitrite reductase/ring-hydroxylating ferredoxin subunit
MSDRPKDSKGRRQVVKFSFYGVDPTWRSLPEEERERGKRAVADVVRAFSDRLQIRSYSLVGTRGDADLLLWQIGDRFEDIQQLASFINGTPIGPYLTMPYSYLAMTRPSVYVSRDQARAERTQLHPGDSKYFFVYPFVKTREWYQLPLEERQAMMDEHIRIGRKYPSVKLNTTYSFGLDDQEFVVSFETDEPADFLDLVLELREAKTSLYTLRDTPVFSCVAMGLAETLDSLAGSGETRSATTAELAWQRVADASDLPPGSSRIVYYEGDQVAIFNVGGRLQAVSNRCSHANGSLAEGVVEDSSVVCPSHRSRFDLVTGRPLEGPATRPLRTYAVRLEQDGVLLGPSSG